MGPPFMGPPVRPNMLNMPKSASADSDVVGWTVVYRYYLEPDKKRLQMFNNNSRYAYAYSCTICSHNNITTCSLAYPTNRRLLACSGYAVYQNCNTSSRKKSSFARLPQPSSPNSHRTGRSKIVTIDPTRSNMFERLPLFIAEQISGPVGSLLPRIPATRQS